MSVEAKLAAGVANIPDHLPGDLVNGYIGRGGDLSHHLHKTGGSAGLAGNAGRGILCQNGIQNRIADLVAELVGMPLGNGFAGKNSAHENNLLDFCGKSFLNRTERAGCFPTIMTTGLAGGLIQPYKGTMPAALEAL